jgi:hypothetical protein
MKRILLKKTPTLDGLKTYLILLSLLSGVVNAQNFPTYGIIHNSTTTADQTIALGVNPEGHLNTPTGS